MKRCFFLAAIFFIAFGGKGQSIDTLVAIGGSRLHFSIVSGKGMPILFEAGGANDGTTWKALLPDVSAATGAPLIVYDRPGFGRSSIDSGNHTIVGAIRELEEGLRRLGFNGPIMLVAHSLGGFYSTLYAYRNPDKVKGVVLIDANVIQFYTPKRVAFYAEIDDGEAEKWRDTHPGIYYIFKDFVHTLDVMRVSPFPEALPVTDIVSEKTPFLESADSLAWMRAHVEFDHAGRNRKGIVAYGAGHYVYRDSPLLTVDAILQLYKESR
jgi:pimeloyl-ACP methyl ester carboxylesterase